MNREFTTEFIILLIYLRMECRGSMSVCCCFYISHNEMRSFLQNSDVSPSVGPFIYEYIWLLRVQVKIRLKKNDSFHCIALHCIDKPNRVLYFLRSVCRLFVGVRFSYLIYSVILDVIKNQNYPNKCRKIVQWISALHSRIIRPLSYQTVWFT